MQLFDRHGRHAEGGWPKFKGSVYVSTRDSILLVLEHLESRSWNNYHADDFTITMHVLLLINITVEKVAEFERLSHYSALTNRFQDKLKNNKNETQK